MSNKVTVASFYVYDVTNDISRVSPTKRTMEEITRLKLTPIDGTQEVVDESELDSNGRYLAR